MRETRDRQYELVAEIGRSDCEDLDGSSATLLVTFTETTYPTTAAAVYACHPAVVDAADTEGASATLTADSTVTIYALNIGTAIPDSGTYVIGAGVGGRVVFRHDG